MTALPSSSGSGSGSLLELHMLGTGTSGCIPTISCLTHPEDRGCECCRSTRHPSGKKNIRRNTSAMLRVKPDGIDTRPEDVKSILIDCGKSFLTSALEWFPQKGFRKIDALIITHPHSDAISGLDDLRGWTLGGAVQDTMDIYVTQYTFNEIERTYPYLVSAHLATGGGDVPAMNYIIFDESKPFECHGVMVTPLPVYHGVYFVKKEPYYSLGFIFNRSIAYISDVSYIPESTWDILLGKAVKSADEPRLETLATGKPPEKTVNDALSTFGLTNGDRGLNGVGDAKPRGTGSYESDPILPVLVIDCLRVYPHTSHFGLAQAIATARRLGSLRNYLLGFAHRVAHATWETICHSIEAGERPQSPPDVKPGGLQSEAEKLAFGAFSPHMKHSEDAAELKEIALQVVEEWEGGPKGPLWARPTFDGHCIAVDERNGLVYDDEYASEAIWYR